MFLNLTQHAATADQKGAGVVDLDVGDRQWLRDQLTFNTLPTADDVRDRAHAIHDFVVTRFPEVTRVMLGGAPYLMPPLQRLFADVGVRVVYAFSVRDVQEVTNPDGSVSKKTVFRHAGFVDAA